MGADRDDTPVTSNFPRGERRNDLRKDRTWRSFGSIFLGGALRTSI